MDRSVMTKAAQTVIARQDDGDVDGNHVDAGAEGRALDRGRFSLLLGRLRQGFGAQGRSTGDCRRQTDANAVSGSSHH